MHTHRRIFRTGETDELKNLLEDGVGGLELQGIPPAGVAGVVVVIEAHLLVVVQQVLVLPGGSPSYCFSLVGGRKDK